MDKVSEPGRYLGYFGQHKIDLTKNGCIQFVGRCIMHSYQAPGGKGYTVLSEAVSGMAWITLTKLNRQLMERNLENLRNAFSWEGDLINLQEMDLSETEVSVTVEDTDRGPRITWINPAGNLAPLSKSKLSEVNDLFLEIAGATPAPQASSYDETLAKREPARTYTYSPKETELIEDDEDETDEIPF